MYLLVAMEVLKSLEDLLEYGSNGSLIENTALCTLGYHVLDDVQQ